MEEEPFKVTWHCRYSKGRKSFVFTHYIDDVMNKRMVFTNEDTLEVTTIHQDSYAWMVSRPLRLDLNEN